MPVDLSMIGLDGQKAYYDRMESAARTRSYDVSSQKTAQDLEQAQRLQALSDQASAALSSIGNREQTGVTGDPAQAAANMTSYADPMEVVADIYMKGGAPKEGMDILSKAATIRKQEDEMRTAEVNRNKTRLETIQKGAVIVGQKLGKARNQSEWEQGLVEVEQAGIIEPHLMAQLKGMAYDPDVASYFFDQSITAAEQARMDLQAQGQDDANRRANLSASQRQQLIRLAEVRAEDARRYHDAALKAGGKSSAIPAPNSDAVKVSKHALMNGPFKGADLKGTALNDFNAAVDYVAGQAQQLVRENKAMDFTTAVNQAVIRAEASGAFTTIPGREGLWGIGATPDKKEFSAAGLKPETAIPLPPGIKSAADAAKTLKKGKYYNTSRGPAKWNGKAWEQ